MKQFYIIVAMLLLSISALAQDGRSLYNKYSDLADVEAVYISPAMFRLIGKTFILITFHNELYH